jgi:hypothetical protein
MTSTRPSPVKSAKRRGALFDPPRLGVGGAVIEDSRHASTADVPNEDNLTRHRVYVQNKCSYTMAWPRGPAFAAKEERAMMSPHAEALATRFEPANHEAIKRVRAANGDLKQPAAQEYIEIRDAKVLLRRQAARGVLWLLNK